MTALAHGAVNMEPLAEYPESVREEIQRTVDEMEKALTAPPVAPNPPTCPACWEWATSALVDRAPVFRKDGSPEWLIIGYRCAEGHEWKP